MGNFESAQMTAPQMVQFRKGEDPARIVELAPGSAEAVVLPNSVRSELSMRDQIRQTLEQWDRVEVTGSLLPADRRHPRVGRTLTVGDHQLVFAGRGKRDDGTNFNHIEARSLRGDLVDKVELDFEGFTAVGDADCAISFRENMVWIFSPKAVLTASYSLQHLPEMEAVRDAHDQHYRSQDLPFGLSKKDAHPRVVAASLQGRLLAVGIVDSLFIYGFDGEVLAALSLPRLGYREDWVYFLRFTDDGQSLYAGGHSGLVVRVDLRGAVQETWQIGSAPHRFIDTGAGLSGLTRTGSPFRLLPGGRADVREPQAYPSGDIVGPYLVAAEKKEVAVLDLRTFAGWRVELPQPVTAVYLEDGELAYETATRKFKRTSQD